MKYIYLSAFFFLLHAGAAHSQTYSRVRIGGTAQQMHELGGYGLLDHFHAEKDGVTAELESSEIQALRSAGYTVTVQVPDMAAYYSARAAHPPETDKAGGGCGAEPAHTDPAHFHTGSMGGYLTYTEILAELDSMAARYPHIFKAKAPVGTFRTYENRPLYWVKISDNPGTDENEPRVFYNALIHAREGVSVMQLVYFMWYVLENYDTDAEIKYLVDNSELYFIPVVNPDGYVYNQTTNPNGGGMHRKNRRPTGGTNPGVDLNRNFGYQWGVSGSSNNTSNDTYRGPSAFSEPETQAFKWFAEQYGFTAALTHHSYADMLLWPYGYADVQTPDNALYAAMTTEMVSENHFTNIQSVGLYPAAGDTDDWMYTATPEKPKVLAMTPETGNDADGFWPVQSRILPISRGNLKMNLDLVRFVVKYGRARATGSDWVSGGTAQFTFDFTRFGRVNGSFTVSLQSLSAAAQVTGSPVTVDNPAQFTAVPGGIAYTVAPGTPGGTPLRFVLTTDNGAFRVRDTVDRIYGQPTAVFTDHADQMTAWTSLGGGWNTTTSTFVSPPSSITDSPSGNYADNANTGIVLTDPVSLSGAEAAQLRFWARWDIEAGYDYVQLEATADNGLSWIPLCGKYTKTGGPDQTGAVGEPLYDGTQNTWVPEEISLDAFLGNALKFRFRLRSDNGTNADGFYFDDFEVRVMTANSSVAENAADGFTVYPVPSTGHVFVSGLHGAASLSIVNTAGQTVWRENGTYDGTGDVNAEHLAEGIYFMTIHTENRYRTVKIILRK